jgi:uncharacterized protein YqeY
MGWSWGPRICAKIGIARGIVNRQLVLQNQRVGIIHRFALQSARILKGTAMSLRAQLTDAMKEAMKAKDAKRLATVRLMLAALKDKDIAARSETNKELVSDDDILTLLAKMIKQREESAAVYRQGGRPELAENEEAEIAIIRTFMPKQMDEAEARAAIHAVIAETGAASIKDMGKVMAVLKERYAGQMDFGKASAATKDALSGK